MVIPFRVLNTKGSLWVKPSLTAKCNHQLDRYLKRRMYLIILDYLNCNSGYFSSLAITAILVPEYSLAINRAKRLTMGMRFKFSFTTSEW